MSSHHRQPAGRVTFPLYVFSFVALILGVSAEAMGVFSGLNESLKGGLESGGMILDREAGIMGAWGFIGAAAVIFGLTGAVLATPGTGRRLVLGVTALVLAAALIPVFAVWGVFWKPFGLLLGLLWGWLSAFLYARVHRMPAEGELMNPANVISMNDSQSTPPTSRRADG
ncbi:MAG: hypothetical protein ACSHYF_08850 [Verrucomicrobiaceae bacterium]